MVKVVLLVCVTVAVISCSSTRETVIQSFSPIAIDTSKVVQKDYSELIREVNSAYGGAKEEFDTATLLSESSNYIYVRVGSSLRGSCYKVTVDLR
ncbi:MAG: hypothetical protein GX640_23605, partial [Fibrobacter sp.]|nr:hypothetical protein [Fibrobacter sp.]